MSLTNAIIAALALSSTAAAGETVSQQPPPVYRQHLAPLLTPADQAFAGRDAFRDSDAAGVVLLYETVRIVDSAGRVCIAIHRMNLARTDAGVNSAGEEVQSYRKLDQKIHMALAQSIQPDGTRQPVAPNGSFLQTPQREADASLYTDVGELVIVFPNVKPGTVTESIVVIEDTESRIPNEYTTMLAFSGGWPMVRVRHVIDLDAALGRRLKITPTGTNVPEPQRTTLETGDWRWTWTGDLRPKTAQEPRRAPASQVGPVVWLSTLKDWNAFDAWYQGLLKDRSRLSAAVKEKADAWTESATNPMATIGILLEKVAREIRYTGLEFGLASFQPQEPDSVWNNQYGDCKDKANLLRALLAHKGIRSWLALVNTEHLGRVEKNSPDYRHFDHAILAVSQPDGSYLFCDPTLRYAVPGLLTPDDADREVLVMKEDGAEFVNTPLQNAGTLRYDFDLKLRSNGDLEGWLTIDSTDYWGAYWADCLLLSNREEISRQMTSILRDFYPGAELIDVKQEPSLPWNGNYRIRAYWMLSGAGASEERTETVMFPQCHFLLPDVGEKAQRVTPYYQWVTDEHVRCRIQLPEGWAAPSLPRALQIEAAPVTLSARWDVSEGALTGDLQYGSRSSRVPPEQFALLYNAVQSLATWIDKPVTVSCGAQTVPAPAPTDLTDFPLLPTGEGQLELVEHRYPVGGNPALRREALRRVTQWFPDDKTSRFVAGLRLIELDLDADAKDASALQRLGDLVQSVKTDVDSAHFSWGEYQLASRLVLAERRDEALAIFARQARDSNLAAFRRGWSALEAVKMTEEENPDEALAILQTTVDLGSPATPELYERLARLRLKRNQADALRRELQSLVSTHPQTAGRVLEAMTNTAKALLADGRQDDAAALAEIVEELVKAGDEFQSLAAAVSSMRENLDEFALYQRIATGIKQLLAADAPGWWASIPISESLRTRDDFLRALEENKSGHDPHWHLRHQIEILLRFPPDPEDFPERVWNVAASFPLDTQDTGIRDAFLEFCDQLPAPSPWRYEGRFLRARVLMASKNLPAALALYDELLADPKLPPVFRPAAFRLKGELLESRRDYAGALAMYHELEENPAANLRSYNGLLRAVFLNLARNDSSEALRLIALLAKTDAQVLSGVETQWQIVEFTALARIPSDATDYWHRQASWWPQWEKLEARLELAPLGDEIVVPVIPDLAEAGRQLGLAVQAKDKPAVAALFRNFIHGARWLPRLAGETAGVMSFIDPLFPESRSDFHALAIAMLKDLHSKEPEIEKLSTIQLTVHYLNSEQPAAAEPLAVEYVKVHGTDDLQGHDMARLWGLAALQSKHDLNPPTLVLERLLAGPAPINDRLLMVIVLADLYRALGRQKDEVDLLRRELDHPAIKAHPSRAGLQVRFDNVRTDGDASVRFSKAVAGWLSAHKPVWYDYAQPQDLSDARYRDVEAILRDPPQDMLRAEIVKFGLLVAQSPEASYPRKSNAFTEAIRHLASLTLTVGEGLDLYASVYDDPGFDETIRSCVLWYALARIQSAAGDTEPCWRHPLAARFNERQNKYHAPFGDHFRLLQDPKGDWEGYLRRLLDSPLDSQSLDFFSDGFRRLLRQGKLDAAQRIYDRLEEARLDADIEEPRGGIQLRFMRQLNDAKKAYPRHKALSELLFSQIPSIPGIRLDNWHEYVFTDHLDAPTALRWRWSILRDAYAELGDLDFWEDMTGTLPQTPEFYALRCKLAEAALRHSPDDLLAADAVWFARSVVDIDDAPTRRQLLEWLQPFRDADKWPCTQSIIRIIEADIAWRTGQPLDVETVLDNMKHPRASMMRSHFKLSYYFQQRDSAALRPVLQGMTADQWVSPYRIPAILPALELCGMTDEAQVVRNAGRKELYRAVLRSWCTLEKEDAIRAIKLAEALGAADALPKTWLDHLTCHVQNTLYKNVFNAKLADMKGDWETLLKMSDAVLAESPAGYDMNWLKAKALDRLGRGREAMAPLKIFVLYCHDALEYPAAVKRLQELQAENP